MVGEGSFMLRSLDTSLSLSSFSPIFYLDTFNLGHQVSQRQMKMDFSSGDTPGLWLPQTPMPEPPSSFRKAFSHGLLSPGQRSWGEGQCMMWGLKVQ